MVPADVTREPIYIVSTLTPAGKKVRPTHLAHRTQSTHILSLHTITSPHTMSHDSPLPPV